MQNLGSFQAMKLKPLSLSISRNLLLGMLVGSEMAPTLGLRHQPCNPTTFPTLSFIHTDQKQSGVRRKIPTLSNQKSCVYKQSLLGYAEGAPCLKMVFNLRTFSFAESVEDDPTPPKSFSLKELRVATHNFLKDNILGEGGFCTVYRGRLADGSLVAVKRARSVHHEVRKEQLEEEMKVGSAISTHPNVLCLRGFCRTKKELLLVYPLMVNNTLSYHLRERPDRFARPLDWTTRKRIALGVAKGLAHLHNQGNIKILHRNICSYNILLNEHFEAEIGGFALAMIMHEGNVEEGTIEWPMWSADSGSDSQSYQRYEYVYVDTTIRGTCGFIAPEYLYTCKCTLKNDVYAYGKMLLELISGQPILKLFLLEDDENLSYREWIDDFPNKSELGRVIDPNLQGNYVEEEAAQLIRLALLCAHEDPSVRLEMSEVVRMLQSQFLLRDLSSRRSWSQSEYDSTPYYSFPPSPQGIAS